jgi:predicted transposase YdaD
MRINIPDIQHTIDTLDEKSKEETSYKIVCHPSVISYDYRIAWTWEEMDKRNKSNALKDKIRLAC